MRWTSLVASLVVVGCAGAVPFEPDGGTDPGSCMLGTPDHCGTCTNACPGTDSASTTRTCSAASAAGTCGIACKGEFYDLDGNAANGCEAEDAPAHDSATTAVAITLPNTANGITTPGACDGATNPCGVTSRILSDTRRHEAAPINRPVGRDDWYRIDAVGAGAAGNVGACLSITNYPADNHYEVCISESGTATPTVCTTAVGGGQGQCVSPSAATSVGTFYVRVRKLAGTNTANGYALWLTH